MATATCPECDADVTVDEVDADIGDEVSCPECGQNLVVSGTEPLELDFADEDDDDDEEEDDDDEVDDDDDLADDDEEREDGDFEE
jgi:lysine biosynthesis protein LysW